jgi:hypothetical protein
MQDTMRQKDAGARRLDQRPAERAPSIHAFRA